MQGFADPQLDSPGTSPSPSMTAMQEHPRDASWSQGRQPGTADDPPSQNVDSQNVDSQNLHSPKTELTAGAHSESSRPSEQDVRRFEASARSGLVPQEEMSLRDLALAEVASEPDSAEGKLGHEPATSGPMSKAGQAGKAGTPSQLLFTSQQQQEQQQQQPPRQLRQQLSGNPFQAAAMASDTPAGDEIFPSRSMGADAADTMPASTDNPFASPDEAGDARQPLNENASIPGNLSRNQSGMVAAPHQNSEILRVPEHRPREAAGPQVQAGQAAGEDEAAHVLDPSLPASHGSAVSMPDGSMHTATSIAQLLADLPPAGT